MGQCGEESSKALTSFMQQSLPHTGRFTMNAASVNRGKGAQCESPEARVQGVAQRGSCLRAGALSDIGTCLARLGLSWHALRPKMSEYTSCLFRS